MKDKDLRDVLARQITLLEQVNQKYTEAKKLYPEETEEIRLNALAIMEIILILKYMQLPGS